MFSGIDLSQFLLFPVKDSEARKNFLIGCAVALAGFIIPVIPYLFIFGYTAGIARQILNGESPRMTTWSDWNKLFRDGAKMFGVRAVYLLPIFIPAFLIVILSIAFLFITESVNGSEIDTIANLFFLVAVSLTCLIMLIILPLTFIIPAAEMHAVDKNEFAAGFRFREWWLIFRANLGGFIMAFVIFYAVTMLLTIVMQIMIATVILSCLLPFFMPALTMYSTLIMYATIAQAYKTGKDKLAQAAV